MTRRVTETIICDRCGREYATVTPMKTIIGLSYMVVCNGGGSRPSDMGHELCAPCAAEFLAWFRAGKKD